MEQLSVREASTRIDALVDELERSAVPLVMTRVQELVRCVMALHGDGLRRILDAVGPDTLRLLARDEVVGNLLVLHDLHPDALDARVRQAIEQVRSTLGSHADDVSLDRIDEHGVVHLRLSSTGCSATAVREAVEEALLVTAPDVVAVETELDVGPALLQIPRFRPHQATA